VTYRLEVVNDEGAVVASYSNLAGTSHAVSADIMVESGWYTWQVTAIAGSTPSPSLTSQFTLNHTDHWLVATPGWGASTGQNVVSVFYKPPTGGGAGNLQLLRSFAVNAEAGASGELLPAIGDVEYSKAGKEIVLGTGINGSNQVYIYGSDGTFIRSFVVFTGSENPSGRVHVAIGEVDASNPGNEIIVGTGSKYFIDGTLAAPTDTVRVYRPSDGYLLFSFSPSFANPSGEVWVASGDLFTSEAGDEIVCGSGPFGERAVLIYRGDGVQVGAIYSPQQTPVLFDTAVAVGDFSSTNAGNEILVGAGFNAANKVALYTQGGTRLDVYNVFTQGQNNSGNVDVGAGMVDVIDDHELLVGTGLSGKGYLQILRSNGALVLLQQVLPKDAFGGEVHVAGNR
jgi:hypothetical protein